MCPKNFSRLMFTTTTTLKPKHLKPRDVQVDRLGRLFPKYHTKKCNKNVNEVSINHKHKMRMRRNYWVTLLEENKQFIDYLIKTQAEKISMNLQLFEKSVD